MCARRTNHYRVHALYAGQIMEIKYCFSTFQSLCSQAKKRRLLTGKYQIAKECGIDVQVKVNDLSGVSIETNQLKSLSSLSPGRCPICRAGMRKNADVLWRNWPICPTPSTVREIPPWLGHQGGRNQNAPVQRRAPGADPGECVLRPAEKRGQRGCGVHRGRRIRRV